MSYENTSFLNIALKDNATIIKGVKKMFSKYTPEEVLDGNLLQRGGKYYCTLLANYSIQTIDKNECLL